MAKGGTNAGGGGTGKSSIIVYAPTGSAVYIVSQDGRRKDTGEKNGVWTFKGCDVGTWVVTAVSADNQNTATREVVIQEEGQMMRYEVFISYIPFASDFDWSLFGTLGVDYEIVDDSDNTIEQSLWPKTENWKARLLTSNTLKPLETMEVDVFMVGGGSGSRSAGGGGGGYTKTEKNVKLIANTEYPIVIGAGGITTSSSGTNGGATTAFGLSVDGGVATTNVYYVGSDGGSGGGAGGNSEYTPSSYGGAGGADGADGNTGSGGGGKGQGTTTREFGEPTGKTYAGGGGGGGNGRQNGSPGGETGGAANSGSTKDAEPNTGGGAGGKGSNSSNRAAGSGIVVIRNARTEVA